MSDAADLPFTFLRDLFDDAEPWSEPSDPHTADEPYVASRAAMLDATANVLAAMRELLQATEDMVRLRRDRLTDPTRLRRLDRRIRPRTATDANASTSPTEGRGT